MTTTSRQRRAAFTVVGLFSVGLITLLSNASFLPAAEQTEKKPPDEPVRVSGRTDRYGDPLPEGALARLGTTRLRHGGRVTFVRFAADRKTIFSRGQDDTFRVWDIATGRELRRFAVTKSKNTREEAASNRHSFGVFALSADMKTLAWSDEDTFIAIWDVGTGKLIGRLPETRSVIQAIAFAPGSRVLAAVDDKKVVRLWDVFTRTLLHELPPYKDLVYQLEFSPNGRVLAAYLSRRNIYVTLVDAATGRPLAGFADKEFYRVAFSPDGTRAACADTNGTVTLRDLKTGKVIYKWERPIRNIHHLFFSPDGKLVAAAGYGEPLRRWDAATGAELPSMENAPKYWREVAFSPDAKLIVGGNVPLHIYEAQSGRHIGQLSAQPGSLVFSADSRLLAIGGWDGCIEIWDLAKSDATHRYDGHRGRIYSIAFHPDGKHFVSCGHDGGVRIWDWVTGRQVRRLAHADTYFDGHPCLVFPSSVGIHTHPAVFCANTALFFGSVQKGTTVPIVSTSLALSPDGTLLATGSDGRGITIWDVRSSKPVKQFRGVYSTRKFDHHEGRNILFSPDGKLLAVSIPFSNFTIIDVVTGRIASTIKNSFGLKSLAFTPDSKFIASSGEACRAQLHEVASGKFVHLFEIPSEDPKWMHTVDVSPDGQLLAMGGEKNVIWFWDLQSRKLVHQWKWDDGGELVSCLRFSPDGRMLAAFNVVRRVERNSATPIATKSVRIWECATRKERLRLIVNTIPVECIEFSPDGRYVATASADTTALVWDIGGLGNDPRQPFRLSQAQLESFWGDLGSEDARQAYRAMRTFVTGHVDSVPFLKDRLASLSAELSKQITRWIGELDRDEFAVRENASEELAKLEWMAEPALQEVLARKQSPETRRRVQQLLQALQPPYRSPHLLRKLRAIEALEHIRTPQSRLVLKALAKENPGGKVAADATASLDRLAKRDQWKAEPP